VPTPEGGTHEAGFWSAILKGIRAYGERVKNRKAELITRDDMLTGGCALCLVFIREPQFVGQTKDRLATEEAARLVEGAVRDHFDTWLAADPKAAGAILDFLILRAEERLRRARKGNPAQDRHQEAAPARQAGRLHRHRTATGQSCSSSKATAPAAAAKMARDRTNQALLPLRGKILNVLGAASGKMGANAEINDLCQALGVGWARSSTSTICAMTRSSS
jgi:topoisomerase IV subunit B